VSRRGERGAVAVEAALVTPLVLALVFGIIESAFLMKDVLAASSAVRAGVRMASAQPRTSTFAQAAADEVAKRSEAINKADIQQLWVYKVAAGSDKPVGVSGFSDCTTCVKFRWNAATSAFAVTSDGWSSANQNACPGSLGGPPDRIGVYLEVKHEAFTGLVFSTMTISEKSILSLEPIPAAGGCKP
jgi:Flp pilus assembly protein TadG